MPWVECVWEPGRDATTPLTPLALAVEVCAELGKRSET